MYLNSMIMSRFLYCMTSWSQACKTVLEPVHSLYKQAIKIHDKKHRRYHHCPILSKYSILSFDNLIIFANLSLLFKVFHGAAPPLRAFVSLTSEISKRVTRSSSRGECRPPNNDKALTKKSFAYVASKLWNTLPTEILTCTGFPTFARLLKKWLLSKQQCDH